MIGVFPIESMTDERTVSDTKDRHHYSDGSDISLFRLQFSGENLIVS